MSTEPAEIPYEASAGFVQLLDVLGCTLAFSVYTAHRVILLSAEAGRLHIHSRSFNRPMGIAADLVNGNLRLAVAAAEEVVVLADAPLLAPTAPGAPGIYQHLLVPRARFMTGDLDGHDLVRAGGALYVANTRFSCIARIDEHFSFTPVWQPPFVTQLTADDRCHLNGLAVAEDRIVYATAFGRSDVARGWSAGRATGGVLLSVPDGELVLEGLSAPHSPRVFAGELYVMESGAGRILRVDRARRSAEPVAELPGFVRGCDCLGDVLFVGLSRLRANRGTDLPIERNREQLICGIAAVDRRRGIVLGWLRFHGDFDEIFEVKVLPNFRRGAMLGVDDDGHRAALVLPGRAFWVMTPDAGNAAEASSR